MLPELDDYKGKKFVSIQKAAVKLDETHDEKKRFSKLENTYIPSPTLKNKLFDLTNRRPSKPRNRLGC